MLPSKQKTKQKDLCTAYQNQWHFVVELSALRQKYHPDSIANYFYHQKHFISYTTLVIFLLIIRDKESEKIKNILVPFHPS